MSQELKTPPPAYFGSLTVENVKSFKGKQDLDLTDGNGKPVQWTIILGNNNTGKTTLLKLLADLEPIPVKMNMPDNVSNGDSFRYMPRNLIRVQNSSDKSIVSSNKFKVDATVLVSSTKNNKNFISKNSFSELKTNIPATDVFGLVNGQFPPDVNINDYKPWAFSPSVWRGLSYEQIGGLYILSYGVNRRMGEGGLTSTSEHDIFNPNEELINAEAWLLQAYLAKMNKVKGAAPRYDKIKELLTNILPDVSDLNVVTDEKNFQSYVVANTDYGKVRLRDLGYGYQSMLTLIVDISSKMFDRYPKKTDPLAQPSIVIIDEIDLHLHPAWQRKIVKDFSNFFPNTQFIVTAHSPLVVQSAENANIVLLQKHGDRVTITDHLNANFKGWTVEEIMSELMGLEDKTQSEEYLNLLRQFEDALDEEDLKKAQKAYDLLDNIMHPNNHLRSLLRIQLKSLKSSNR